jgi:hypothetical protein
MSLIKFLLKKNQDKENFNILSNTNKTKYPPLAVKQKNQRLLRALHKQVRLSQEEVLHFFFS